MPHFLYFYLFIVRPLILISGGKKVLKKSYARGEITKEEFEEKKKDIQ
ncbi:MAG: SHOCT domain-containing protein [Candidatus Methanoperedens sp.]|nr:SHOCT domain-containing protein [Candidatus Methanoperedens sp.]